MPGKKKNNDTRLLAQVLRAPASNGEYQKAKLSDWLNYADTLLKQNRPLEAVQLLQKLGEVEKGYLARKKLLRIQISRHWYTDAHAVLETLDEREKDVEITSIRAAVALMLGQPEKAIAFYLSALERLPGSDQLAYSMGQCYLALGDRKRAEKWLRRCLEKNSKFYSAYLSLAPFLNSEESLACIGKLEKLLANEHLNERDASALEFATAKLYSNRGNYVDETEQLLRANGRVRVAPIEKLEAENRQQLQAVNEYAKSLHLALTTNSQPIKDATGNRPIVICSMPRSGSSLLETMLTQSEHVSSTGESNSIFAALRKLAEQTETSPHHLMQSQAVDDYRSQLLDIHKEILALYGVDTPAFTDKSMINHLEVGRFIQLYPETRVLWLRRDTRDMAISCYQHLFEGGAGYDYIYSLPGIAAQLRHFDSCMAIWSEYFNKNTMQVSYEELVKQPDKVLSDIFLFLDIEVPQKPDDRSRGNVVLTSSALQVRDGVNTKSLEKWQRYPKLAAAFDAVYSNPG